MKESHDESRQLCHKIFVMNKKAWACISIALAIVVSFAFLRTWQGALPYPADVTTLEKRAQFGDSFAIFSAIVSALGFLGIVVTLALQQLQISQQSQELRRQADRDEANRRRDEIAQFEQLLFRLLDYYKETVESVRIKRSGIETTGRTALALLMGHMEVELKKRRLSSIPPRELRAVRDGTASAAQRLLLDYVIAETCRVVQYTVIYQRRVIATLRALLEHLERKCPHDSMIDAYRALVLSQITHVEIQYIFANVLIHESEGELRDLLHTSGLLTQDSPPYIVRLHKFLYLHLWGIEVGEPTKARRLAFKRKRSAQIRALAADPQLADLIEKYSIGSPMRSEAFRDISTDDLTKVS